MMDFLKDKTIYVESYGCSYNHADARRLVSEAEARGCRQVSPESADVIIINTCTVVESTERAMLRRIRAFADRNLIVTGCMPVVQADKIMAVAHPRILLPEDLNANSRHCGGLISPAVGVVQVGSGCLGACSYCITRMARGRIRCNPVAAICGEVQRLVELGAYEIQLTGQDVSAYRSETGDALPDLLVALADLPGDFAVRVGMLNPATTIPILDALTSAYHHEKIFRFIHVPVQSGSDPVLRTMNRGYSVDDFEAIIAAFRKGIPEIRVSTDFIAGYPTETAEDFSQSLELLERTRPTKVNITRYSARPGTEAAALRDLSDGVKKERSRLLTRTAHTIYDEIYTSFSGRTIDVVVTEQKKPGSVIARDLYYNNVVIGHPLPLGTRCRVTITGHTRHYLRAMPASSLSETR